MYNWPMFEDWDARARVLLGNSSLKNSHVLDIAPLHLRPDAHPGSWPGPVVEGVDHHERWKIDCLHMCMPGPLDLVSQVFFHMLSVISQGGEGEEKMIN
jgi:hypothetical protein